MIRFAAIPVILAVVPLASAQEAGVALVLDASVLEVGEVIDARLVCTNIGRPTTPKAAVPEGLELELAGNAPSQNSQTTIINGRVSSRTTYTYHLRVTALQPGAYTLGPVSVDADGQTYRSEPVKLVVEDATGISQERGDSFIYVDLEVAPRSVYVTESYKAALTIGIRKVEIGGRIIPFNMLRDVLDTRRSDLSIFSNSRVTSSETTLPDSSGKRHRYEVFRVTNTIRAEEVGESQVGPIFLRAEYPTAVRRGFFSRYEVTRSRKETARADAVIVEVKGAPEEGRPADFSGAIGRYKFGVTAKPTRVEQGKPITLTITIGGSPLEGVAGPNLSRHSELASRFDYASDELVGDVESRTKVFRRAVFPKQAGNQTIPPIAWSYFDPGTEKYVTLRSKPIPITVDPPSSDAAPIAWQTLDAGTEETKLTLLTGGISPNYVDPEVVLASQVFALSGAWLLALVAPPIGCLVVTLAVRHGARLRRDPGYARRRGAYRAALTALSRSAREATAGDRLQAIGNVLTDYLSARFKLPPGELTPDEARNLLIKCACDDATVQAVSEFLERLSAARFAPGMSGEPSPDQAAARVRGWLKSIERASR